MKLASVRKTISLPCPLSHQQGPVFSIYVTKMFSFIKSHNLPLSPLTNHLQAVKFQVSSVSTLIQLSFQKRYDFANHCHPLTILSPDPWPSSIKTSNQKSYFHEVFKLCSSSASTTSTLGSRGSFLQTESS